MKKTTLPVKSRTSKTVRPVRKIRTPRAVKKNTPLMGNMLAVVALLIVLVGVAVALALSGRNQDTRQQAAFQGTQPNPETFCGLKVTDNFSKRHFSYRWARSGSNFNKKNAVKRQSGRLIIDTLTPKKAPRVAGVYQLKATDGKFIARTTLRRLDFHNGKWVNENDIMPGYFALEQFHYISPTNNGYNSLRIHTQPDGAFEASLVSIENGQIIQEVKGSKWIPGNVRNLRLELKRKNGKLFGRVYSKRYNVDLLLGPINAWEGSGSLAMHLYANPENRLTASVDNYTSNFCVRSCTGVAQAENFDGDLNDSWYINGVSNDDITNGQLKMQITPEQGGLVYDFLKSKAVSRAKQTSIISIDLAKTKIPQRAQMRFLLTNEPETKYAALIVQPNKQGQLVIRNAFYEYGKLKASKRGKQVIPANTQNLRLRISRNEDKVKVSYKFDGGNWKVLSKYKYYIGPVRTKIELRNIKDKPLRQAAVLTLNTVKMGCQGSLPQPSPVFPSPDPNEGDEEISETPGGEELEEIIVGNDPIETEPIEIGPEPDPEEETEEDWEDDDDWGWDEDDENWEDEDDWIDEEEDPEFVDEP